MKTIGGVPRKLFLEVAEEVLRRFVSLPQNPNPADKGCYICMKQTNGSKTLLIVELGNYTGIDSFKLCQEKANRLLYNNQVSGHISSWQSRDVDHDQYGGAIMAPKDSLGEDKGDMIGSVSGFVEKGDEAVILVIWMVFRWITLKEARQIAAISDNELFEPLLRLWNDGTDQMHYC